MKIRKKYEKLHMVYGDLSIIISKMLCKLDSSFVIIFSTFNVSSKTLFSHVKDRTPLEKRSGVIYRIPCSNGDSVYIDEVTQYLGNRNDVRSRTTKTVLSQHAVYSPHVFDFDGTVILANEDQIEKRKIREIVEIMKDRKSVNFKSDIDDLHDAYAPLIGLTHTC